MSNFFERLRAIPPGRIAVLGATAGLTIVLLVQTLQTAFRSQGHDFTSYLLSAEALCNGGDPYHTGTLFVYVYPLFLAFVLIPLTYLPYWLAELIWFGLSVTSFWAGCVLLARMAGPAIKTDVGWHLALPGLATFVFLLWPIQSNLLCGQVNLIVLLCCVLFLHFFQRENTLAAAAWLGAAIAIKLVPAVLLLFLLVRRRYGVLMAAILFAALFIMLPGIVAGEGLLAAYKTYLHSFLMRSFVNPEACTGVPALAGPPEKMMFLSLKGVVRYFFPSAGSSAWLGGLSLLTALAAMLSVDVMSTGSPPPRRDVWSFCAYLLGCLFVSPMTENHHLVLVMPAVWLVGLKLLFDRSWATGRIVTLASGFAACFLLYNPLQATPLGSLSLVLLLVLLVLASSSEATFRPCAGPRKGEGEGPAMGNLPLVGFSRRRQLRFARRWTSRQRLLFLSRLGGLRGLLGRLLSGLLGGHVGRFIRGRLLRRRLGRLLGRRRLVAADRTEQSQAQKHYESYELLHGFTFSKALG